MPKSHSALLVVGVLLCAGVFLLPTPGGAQSADLAVTKLDTPDPVTAGTNLTYTLTVTNNGPDPAADAGLLDTLPADTTFVSLASPGGWSCATPAAGSGGTISCALASLAVGSAVFTLTVAVSPAVPAGTEITNLAAAFSTVPDPEPENEIGVALTAVAASADLSLAKGDSPDPVTAGTSLAYVLTLTNAGPSAAASVALSDTLPAGTTFQSLSAPAGWSCSTPPVGSSGTVTCSRATVAPGSSPFTLTVVVDSGLAAGTVLANVAAVTSSTADPDPGGESAGAETSVAAAPSVLEIPTLSRAGVALLALLLALGGVVLLRSRL